MPNPTQAALHVDSLLTQLSVGYENTEYIADNIFPIVPVVKQSDKIPEYDQSHMFRDDARLRAPGTKSHRGGWKVTTSKVYFCDRSSFGFEIPDEARANTDAPFNLDRDGVNYVMDKIMLRRERAFAASFFTTGVWGTNKVGTTDFSKWSDYGSSDPLVNLTEYADDMEASIGKEPTDLVLGKQVWVKLMWHPAIIDLIKYTQRGVVTRDLFQSLLDFVRRLHIGRAIVTTDGEEVAEASVSYSRVWGKHALLLYRPDTPSLMRPAAGYTFVWQVVPSALQYMKRMRDEEREVDIVEGNTYFDQKLIVSGAGTFLSGAVA